MSTRIPLFAGCVLVVTGLVGCGKKEAVSAAPPEVLVVDAGTRDVPVYREWIGTIDGSENADVRAQVEGRLIKRSYEEGSIVKKGDPLFEIDPRTYEAEVAQAKSNLEQGKAAAVAAKAEAEREQKLFDQKVVSVQEYTNKTQLNEAS